MNIPSTSALKEILLNEQAFDCETITYCSSFNELIKEDISNLNNRDFSYLCLLLCKCVEQEINSSIVQLMRKQIGIDMPLYYCKYDDQKAMKNTSVKTKYKDICINSYKDREHRDTLKVIPLGDAWAAYNCLDKDTAIWGSYSFLNQDFCALWRKINMYRNEIAHAGMIIDRDTLMDCYELCFEFMGKYVPKLAEIKKSLGWERGKGFWKASTIKNVAPELEAVVFEKPAIPGLMASLITTEYVNDDYRPKLYKTHINGLYYFQRSGSQSYGIMDSNRRVLVDEIIDSICDNQPRNKGIVFKSGGYYGFLPQNGKTLISPEFDDIIFNDGADTIFVLNGIHGRIAIRDGEAIFEAI